MSNIGFIGLGIMGRPMALNLIKDAPSFSQSQRGGLRAIATTLTVAWFLSASMTYAQHEVTFPTAPSARAPKKSEVEAVLTLPLNAKGKSPAVALFHTSGGYEPSAYELYGILLREAGIATLGVILSRSQTSSAPSVFLPHAFGALKFLSSHPQIDASRIGIMGMSLGAHLAIYSSSAILAAEHLDETMRFRAHLAIYPSCYIHENIVHGKSRNKALVDAKPYSKFTGAPVHILAGALDHPDACQEFIDALTPENRKVVALTVYPNTTHSWDVGRNFSFYNRAGCRGKGCQVEVAYNPEVTAKGQQFALDFFIKHLGASQR